MSNTTERHTGRTGRNAEADDRPPRITAPMGYSAIKEAILERGAKTARSEKAGKGRGKSAMSIARKIDVSATTTARRASSPRTASRLPCSAR